MFDLDRSTRIKGGVALVVGGAIAIGAAAYIIGRKEYKNSQTSTEAQPEVVKEDDTTAEKQHSNDPKPVLDRKTGRTYPSISKATKASGVAKNDIYKDLHGESVDPRFEYQNEETVDKKVEKKKEEKQESLMHWVVNLFFATLLVLAGLAVLIFGEDTPK